MSRRFRVFRGDGDSVQPGLGAAQPTLRFRTPKTLHDPDVWYPTNRVAGYWGIATGIVAAVVSISTFFAGLGLPTAPLVNLVPFVVGIAGTLTHGFLVIGRVTRSKQEARTD